MSLGPSIWGPSPFDVSTTDLITTAPVPRGDELSRRLPLVFGDGDPNADVDKKQIAAAADAIRKSGAVGGHNQILPHYPQKMRTIS